MSTVASELMGAVITSAAPEVLPMMGNLAGRLFGVPAVSRIAAGTMWNLCTKKTSPSDVEMEEMGRSFPRGRLTRRNLNRSSDSSSWLRPRSNSVVRLNRTYENDVARRKKVFASTLVSIQLLGALAMSTLALFSTFSLIALSLSPLALGLIGVALAVNGLLTTVLADHFKMNEFTWASRTNGNNWNRFDAYVPETPSNLRNTIWFALSTLVAPLACLSLILSGVGESYEERERYLRNN